MRLKIACRPRYNPWLKNLSKILVSVILLNNISINSFASILSEDTRYETFIDNKITINDILEDDKADMKIKGNTLVNILGTQGRELVFQTNRDDDGRTRTRIFNGLDLKPNTTYSFITNISNLSSSDTSNLKIRYEHTYEDGSVTDIYPEGHWSREKISEGKMIIVFTTDWRKPDSKLMLYVDDVGNSSGGSTTAFTYETSKCMLLEGDWSNLDIPNYFENMKSAGESESNTLEIVSQNKNLLPSSDGWEDGQINTGGTLGTTQVYLTASISTKDYIKLKGGTTYTFSYPSNYQVAYHTWDIDYNYLGDSKWLKDNTFTPKEDCYIKITTRQIGSNASLDVALSKPTYPSHIGNPLTIQLEEGSSATSYALHQEDRKTIRLNDPLRGIERGAKDEITKVNGQWIIERNCGIRSYQESDMDNPNVITDKVNTIYKLNNPIYEPINVNLNINLYEGITHISNNFNIPVTMEVTIDRVLNRAIEYTELAKTTSIIDNLSKARYWINLLKESTKKDQLNEEINNIINLNDFNNVTFETKNITFNTDIYVIPKNTLQMSLNTNSVTFEDFSGAESAEKVNAVQISINSSLPYQLNAYLPTEIQNSDKSNTMDKNILNIKENSESIYQTFVNTTDKIVLKGNCNSGNGLVHGIDIKLSGGVVYKKDVYKTTIKFEAEQK